MKKKEIKKTNDECFKGEHTWWLICSWLFMVSSFHIWKLAGLLMSIGLFGLIAMVLVNVKSNNNESLK